MFEISLRKGYNDLFTTYFPFLRKHNDDLVKLLVYHPPQELGEKEYLLFQHEFLSEGFTSVYQDEYKADIDDSESSVKSFQNFYNQDGIEAFVLKTDALLSLPLTFLAHIYYLTPRFPSSWRH
jgi:hypothetical protein